MLVTYETSKKKNEIRKYAVFSLIAILTGLFQVILVKFFSIGGITPDLLLIICVWFVLSEGQFKGLIFAFTVGVFFDIISLDIIGTNALAKITASLIAGWFYGENKINRNLGTYRFIIIVFITSFFHNILYYFIHIEFSEISFFPFFFKYGIAISAYTSIIALIPMLARVKRNELIR
ncbi:MAG: rod shape-determining protein MreD [bacterium]